MTIFQREPLLFSSHVLKKRDIFSHNHGNLFFVHMVGTMWNKKWIKIMCKRLTIFFFHPKIWEKSLERERDVTKCIFFKSWHRHSSPSVPRIQLISHSVEKNKNFLSLEQYFVKSIFSSIYIHISEKNQFHGIFVK